MKMKFTHHASIAVLLLIADVCCAESPTHLFVFTKRGDAIDRAWALPTEERDRCDAIPGLWLDLDGKRAYSLPQNAGFFVESYSFDQLAEMQSLTALDLSELPVTDKDISLIANSRSLRDLVLDTTPITDAGLKRLAKLETLRGVSLRDIPVTKEALDQFRKECPKVHVHYSGDFKWCNARDKREVANIPLFPTTIVPSGR